MKSKNPTSEASLTYYSYTLKYIKQGVFASKQFIEEIMYSMLNRYKAEYCTHTIELDSMGRNHIHGIMIASTKLRYNSFKYPHCHIYVRRIDSHEDLVNWTSYINKDEETKAIRDYFENNYAFVDEVVEGANDIKTINC